LYTWKLSDSSPKIVMTFIKTYNLYISWLE